MYRIAVNLIYFLSYSIIIDLADKRAINSQPRPNRLSCLLRGEVVKRSPGDQRREGQHQSSTRLDSLVYGSLDLLPPTPSGPAPSFFLVLGRLHV